MNELILGTVNFGEKYGILKKVKLERNEINKILLFCYKNNLLNLDTSPSYGVAEKVLGNYIKSHKATSFKIITKTPINLRDQLSPENYMLKVFERSLKNLNVDNVETLLVHNVDDFLSSRSELLIKNFEKLKKDGKVKKIGISIYDESQYRKISRFFNPDVVQLPINIFDQRTLENGFLNKLRSQKCEIHARSIFLQGILLSEVESIPCKFVKFREGMKKIKSLCKKNGMTKLEVALGFLNSINLVDYKVIGFNSLTQLKQIIFLNKKTKVKKKINYDLYSIKKTKFLDARNW